jgi:hypothetical protein
LIGMVAQNLLRLASGCPSKIRPGGEVESVCAISMGRNGSEPAGFVDDSAAKSRRERPAAAGAPFFNGHLDQEPVPQRVRSLTAATEAGRLRR